MTSNSQSYLIDGYNVLFFLFPNQSLEEARKKLILFLHELSIKCKLVFDGAGEDLEIQSQRKIQIYYTPSYQSADQYIIKLLKDHPTPSLFITVSSDNEVNRRARLYGSTPYSVIEFLEKIGPRKTKLSLQEPEFKDSEQNIIRYQKVFEKELEKIEDKINKQQNRR